MLLRSPYVGEVLISHERRRKQSCYCARQHKVCRSMRASTNCGIPKRATRTGMVQRLKAEVDWVAMTRIPVVVSPSWAPAQAGLCPSVRA